MAKKIETTLTDDSNVEVVESELMSDVVAASAADNLDFLEQEIPADKEAAFKMAKTSAMDGIRYECLKFWMVGRIMHTLIERGEKEKDVVTEVCKRVGMKDRACRYLHAFYQRFAEPKQIIQLVDKKLDWMHFKMLTGVHDEKEQKKLVTGLLNDKIEPDALEAEVEKVQEVKKLADAKVAAKVEDPTKIKIPDVLRWFKVMATYFPTQMAKNNEIVADLIMRIDELDDENKTSQPIVQQCVNLAREARKAIQAEVTHLNDIVKKLDTEVLVLASPVAYKEVDGVWLTTQEAAAHDAAVKAKAKKPVAAPNPTAKTKPPAKKIVKVAPAAEAAPKEAPLETGSELE